MIYHPPSLRSPSPPSFQSRWGQTNRTHTRTSPFRWLPGQLDNPQLTCPSLLCTHAQVRAWDRQTTNGWVHRHATGSGLRTLWMCTQPRPHINVVRASPHTRLGADARTHPHTRKRARGRCRGEVDAVTKHVTRTHRPCPSTHFPSQCGYAPHLTDFLLPRLCACLGVLWWVLAWMRRSLSRKLSTTDASLHQQRFQRWLTTLQGSRCN